MPTVARKSSVVSKERFIGHERGEIVEKSRVDLEVLLDEPAETFVVFFLHVDELDAAAVGADVADDGGEMDFAEAGADFELNGIADAEAIGRFDVGAAEADGFDANGAHHLGLAAHLGSQWRLPGNARVPAGGEKT